VVKRNPKVKEIMLPGQTLAYLLKANSFSNNGNYTTILGYKSKGALLKHINCKGK